MARTRPRPEPQAERSRSKCSLCRAQAAHEETLPSAQSWIRCRCSKQKIHLSSDVDGPRRLRGARRELPREKHVGARARDTPTRPASSVTKGSGTAAEANVRSMRKPYGAAMQIGSARAATNKALVNMSSSFNRLKEREDARARAKIGQRTEDFNARNAQMQ
jgi:hypothetical protein